MIEIGISPIAFTIGTFEVRWYGIFVALAVLTVVSWTLWQVKRGANVSYDTVITAAIVGIPSGIIMSRLLHVFDRWDFYSQNPGQIIGASGLTIFGGVLGAALGIWIYSKFSHINFGYLADQIAPGIILAQAVGRIGCILNGCCYGIDATIPCAIVYTNPDSFAPIRVAVHPTQIYEIIFNLVVFGVLLKLRGRFLIYLSFYALWRLGIDFLREGTPFLFGLHQAQIISIIVLAVAVSLLTYRTRRVTRESTDTHSSTE